MFDRYAAATAPSWGRRALVIASIGLHGAAAIALVIYSIFHVEEIAPPAVSLTFFSAPPPPPPPPPPARKKSSSTVEKKVPTTQIVQPTDVKVVQPKVEEKKQDEKNDDDGEEGGVEGGVKGGVAGGTVGGVVGGTVGGTGTDLTAKPQAGKAVPFFTLDCTKPDPHLPESFTAAHPQQTIKATYKVEFDLSGAVIAVNPVVAVPGADDTIREQIKRTWKCKPKNGQQFPPIAVFPFNFVIH